MPRYEVRRHSYIPNGFVVWDNRINAAILICGTGRSPADDCCQKDKAITLARDYNRGYAELYPTRIREFA